jgi:hypothetical protein
MLRRLKPKLTIESIVVLYTSLVGPHIDYCSSVLFLLNDSQIDKLQKVQNKIMRLILNARRDTHIKDMIDALQWLTIKQRIYFNTIKFLYQIEYEDLSTYIKNKLIKRKTKYNYNLRRKSEYDQPDYLLKTTQNSLFFKGLSLYNKFKLNYNSINNMTELKKCSSEFVKQNYF